jgi:hypothetical protein
VVVDLEHAEPELVSPPGLVLNEAQLLDKRPDRRLGAFQEVDVAPPRLEVGRHLGLVRLSVGDPPDGGERLQWFAVGIDGLRRVEDDPVTFRHLAQHIRLAVVGLCEAALHATLDVVAAHRIHPIGHVRTVGRNADRTGVHDESLWITSGALASAR